MTVTVSYSGQVRAAAGVSDEKFEVPDGCALEQAVARLAASRGAALKSLLLDAAGRVQPALLLFVNDEQVMTGEAKMLMPGDRILLMAPISGG